MSEIVFNPIVPSPARAVERTELPSTGGPEKSSFTDVLKDAVADVDRAQEVSQEAIQQFASGADVDLHDVMIQVQNAELTYRTMMEVRNKIVEAYREIMRLQV